MFVLSYHTSGDILSGMNYPTAKRVLEKDAWTFEELNHFDLLAQRQTLFYAYSAF